MESLQHLSDDDLLVLTQQAMALPDAPSAWIQRAVAVGQAPAESRVATTARAVVKHLVAALGFDSWSTPQLALGLRSMPDRTRHLLFSAQGRDIDLRIIPTAEHFAMAGQVLGPDDGGTVELVHRPLPLAGDEHSGHEAHIASLDELGEFRFGDLRQGTVSIVFRLGKDEVHLPLIDVGERRV
ncbi:hypothetical protein [Ideonella sp. A 288]|uniref:hypothetical protein n=1 Tax=Ideonella sp. A 288 TaxID=1962181 RepID=UPI000B4A920E|nr:hypothetical protein [Ideonella sp. A 288]